MAYLLSLPRQSKIVERRSYRFRKHNIASSVRPAWSNFAKAAAKKNEQIVLGCLHPLRLTSLQSSVIKFVLFLSLYHKGFKNSILPGGGINIVASGLHTHLTGIALFYDISRVALS